MTHYFQSALRQWPFLRIMRLGEYEQRANDKLPKEADRRLDALCEDLGTRGTFLVWILSRKDPDDGELSAGDQGIPREFDRRDFEALYEKDLKERYGMNREGRNDDEYQKALKRYFDDVDAEWEKKLEADARDSEEESREEIDRAISASKVIPRSVVSRDYLQ